MEDIRRSLLILALAGACVAGSAIKPLADVPAQLTNQFTASHIVRAPSDPLELASRRLLAFRVGTSENAAHWRPSSFYANAAPVWTSEGDAAVMASLNVRGLAAPPIVWCVVNGRAVFSSTSANDSALACTSGLDVLECECVASPTQLAYGVHTVALYASDGAATERGSGLTLLGRPVTVNLTRPHTLPSEQRASLRTRASRSDAFLRTHTPAGTGSLGVYYTTYQQVSASIYQNISQLLGRPALSMEDVLREDAEASRFADSVAKYLPQAASPQYQHAVSIFQHQPALGYYCYYRRRPNETVGYIPDCQEASSVLRTHAAELTSAGFEFVTPDATNWEQDPRNATDGSDLYQLRPTEVLAEEWMDMRLGGQSTPQLSTDDLVSTACTENCLFNWYLSEFFNNASYLDVDMIWTTPDKKYKIYPVVYKDTLSMPSLAAIQQNGGRNDVLTPLNWAAPGPWPSYYANGYWTYFAPCTALNRTGTLVFANDIIDLDTPCNHFKTTGSAVGSQWTVSTATAISNMPLGVNAKMNGLFLKKQFYDVFADPLVDYLWMPSWNEFLVVPINMSVWDMTNPWFYSIGASPDDPDRHTLFLDGFGAERSRTIEPGLDDAGYYYELVASCMRVYRLQVAAGIVGNGTSCSVAGEECCVIRENEQFTQVWSLLRGDGRSDALLTNNEAERDAVLAGPGNWSEVCNSWFMVGNGGASRTCTDSQVPWLPVNESDIYERTAVVPFIAYANSSTAINGTHAVARCVNGTLGFPRHFLSTDLSGCDGLGTLEYTLAVVNDARSGLLIRSMRRCFAPASAAWYTAINTRCNNGDTDQGVLGWVM